MKKKKIVMLMSACVSLLVLSTTFSLAWYVSSDVAYISSVNIDLLTHADLRISLTGDDGTFKEEITKEELDRLDYFLPVSSMNSAAWTETKSDTPLFYENGTNVLSTSGIGSMRLISQGYFQREFYLKCDKSCYVVVDPESSITADADRNHEAAQNLIEQYPELTVDELEEKLNNLVNSLRVSILVDEEQYYNYSVYDFYKNGTTLFGGILDSNTDGYYDYYTDSEGNQKEFLYGEVSNRGDDNANLVYEEARDTEETPRNSQDCFDAVTKKGVRHLDVEKSIENGVAIAEEKAYSLDEISQDVTDITYNGKDSGTVDYKIPLRANEPRHIVLSVYMEGWDRDNINYTKGASFDMNLSFMLLPGVVNL